MSHLIIADTYFSIAHIGFLANSTVLKIFYGVTYILLNIKWWYWDLFDSVIVWNTEKEIKERRDWHVFCEFCIGYGLCGKALGQFNDRKKFILLRLIQRLKATDALSHSYLLKWNYNECLRKLSGLGVND